MFDGLTCAFEHCAMGDGTERDAASEGMGRDGDGRPRRQVPRARRRRPKGRPLRRRADRRVGPPTPRRRRWSSTPTRACDRRTTVESLGGLAPRVRWRRQRHRWQRQPDLRRRLGRGGHVPGRSRSAGGSTARRGGLLRPGRRPRRRALLHQPSRAIKRALDQAGDFGRRSRPLRDQRGVRRRRPRLDEGPRRDRRRSSTSMAARSRSATRSVRRATAWR